MKQDNHNLEEQWLELKELLKDYESMDNDLYSFVIGQNKRAAKRIRKKLLNIHKIAWKLRKDILIQRKESESEYEDY
jgi:phosphate uptake regulator